MSKRNKKERGKTENDIKAELNETDQEITLEQFAWIIKSEFDTILLRGIPMEVEFLGETINERKRYIVGEKANTSYEVLLYIMYMYKKVNGYNVEEFKRILHPINNYKETMRGILYGMDEMEFLGHIAQLKGKM
jgi:Ni,Fe-hydrogenase III component G